MRQGSNLQRAALETAALPVELRTFGTARGIRTPNIPGLSRTPLPDWASAARPDREARVLDVAAHRPTSSVYGK